MTPPHNPLESRVAPFMRISAGMLRVTRHGETWKATEGASEATGSTRLEALRSLKNRQRRNTLAQRRRWVVYAVPNDCSLSLFAETVSKAGGQWKPVAVEPFRVDEAVKALQPEAVVVATKNPEDRALLRRTFALHGQQRIVVDDRGFTGLTRLLGARPG